MTPRAITAGALMLLAVLATAQSLSAQEATEPEPWPFGKAGRFDRGKDLWNLGLLGLKCWDASRPLPAARGSGRHATQVTNEDPKDLGPPELKVIVLYPDGPAAKAGIKVGDVIVGAGKSNWKKGFREPLAALLTKAEGAKGQVSLLVQREGQKKPVRVKVEIPASGRAALKPTSDKGRKLILDKALAWLATKQAADGGYKETLSGRGGAVIMASLAGLAWLSGGSDLQGGPHKENIEKALAFVTENLHKPGRFESQRKPGEPSWDQSNWPLAHAGMFLGELHARTANPAVKLELQKIVDQLSKNQVPSGGWAHGTGGKNALGYLELNIVTGLALYALGMANQAGCQIDTRVILGATRYIKQSSNGGGVGYSANAGQAGQGNIGRSAATWLGYRGLGLGKKPDTVRIGNYVKRNVDNVQGGHASLMQHILLAGVAANALGKGSAKKFWNALERDLVLARAPDGSLQPRPWRETLGMGSNSDVSFGEVWTTSAWAIVLGCQPVKNAQSGLPAMLGHRPPKN